MLAAQATQAPEVVKDSPAMQYLKLTETLKSVVVFPAADKNAWFEGFVESIPVVVNASSKLVIKA